MFYPSTPKEGAIIQPKLSLYCDKLPPFTLFLFYKKPLFLAEPGHAYENLKLQLQKYKFQLPTRTALGVTAHRKHEAKPLFLFRENQ